MNLETQVKNYDEAYRNGNALISDKEFDELEKKLFTFKPESDYFKQQLTLPTLQKGTVDEFIKGLPKGTQVLVQPKYDGVAVAIKYRNGFLQKAITRKGKDITDHIVRIKTIPLYIPIDSELVVRGELYAKDYLGSVSQRIAGGYIRNICKNPNDYLPNPKLTFAAFEIINSNLAQINQCKYLSRLNFHTARWSLTDIKYLKDFMYKYLHKKLWNNIPIDGIVVKINSRKEQIAREKQYDLFPYSKMAIKY